MDSSFSMDKARIHCQTRVLLKLLHHFSTASICIGLLLSDVNRSMGKQ